MNNKASTTTKWFKHGVVSKEAEMHWFDVFFKQYTPLELLEKKAKEFEHSLGKSKSQYEQGKISIEIHLMHYENLTNLIRAYLFAIGMLKACADIPQNLKK